jgi:hypothetical protein
MSDRDPRDPRRDEDALIERLASELRDDVREPPAEGIAAVRMQAQARRDELAARSARSARGTPRRRFLLGGALASAGAALGIGGYALLEGDPMTPPTEPVAVSGAADGVQASAELINHTWGVEYMLTVRGLDVGRTYDVVYRATDGREVPAGSFVAVQGEQLCRMTAALLRPQTRAIEVLDEDGATVLRSRLS